jgi:hypothetical protein
MSRLSDPNSGLPIHQQDLTEEERLTYRRWARASYLFYAVLVAGLVAVGFSSRQSDSPLAASQTGQQLTRLGETR